ARALRCLYAELRHREERLRAAGAEDLAELRRRDPDGPALPRLVVVVDEFATLAAELPDFVDSLVGVAQRGRSLGVHLVLATQRPSGAVSERIRANTALRVALRVHDAADSTDVVDAPGAAALPRATPGRALVRLGPGELVAIQVARSTAPNRARRGQGAEHVGAPVAVEPLAIVGSGPADARDQGSTASSAGPSDLDVLVGATVEAWGRVGDGPPRRPWPEPLPLDLDLDRATTVQGASPQAVALVLGRADRPELQRHEPWRWELDQGPLLAVGLPGSGTTTLAATAVLAAAALDPRGCHVHVVDVGAGGLAPLAGLPHVGAVIGADDVERQRRLLADLTDDLARRRAHLGGRGPGAPTVRRLLVVDGLGGFRARWPDTDPSGTWDRLLALLADGSGVGIHVLVTAEGVASAPHRVVAACRQRLVLRLGERADHAAFGIPAAAVPDLPPGRGIAADGPHLVQVARPARGLAAAVAVLAGRHGPSSPDVAAVGHLPPRVDRRQLGPAEVGDDGTLSLPIGIADEGLVPAVLRLGPGGHAVVAGPPRSGRTTALVGIARTALAAGVHVAAVSIDPAPWRAVGIEHHLPTDELSTLLHRTGPQLVLVDDADRTADDHPVLGALAGERHPERHVVASARSDRLRSAYGHWTRELRADRCGLLLAPDPDLDGDLLGTRVPRHLAAALPPGRGWACGTVPEGVVQVAGPDGP
ncbi:MAG: hypothetical protein KF703_19770, partial [Actinobacteria bacterium]|nr:hypothetical protein [Actinomycetota bacterium]